MSQKFSVSFIDSARCCDSLAITEVFNTLDIESCKVYRDPKEVADLFSLPTHRRDGTFRIVRYLLIAAWACWHLPSELEDVSISPVLDEIFP